MAAGGMHEGPTVCPFVALDSDRDRRLDEPDHRHRCYAVPTPEPRAIAHQQAYCLSPGFTLCPIFQDWAKRAAANPVATPQPAGASMVGEPEQLGAFDAPAPAPAGAATVALNEPESPYARPQVPPPDRPAASEPTPPGRIERVASSREPGPPEPAPLPAFLASRERASAPQPQPPPEAAAPPATAYPPAPVAAQPPRVRSLSKDERAAQREALIPSWDREERFSPPVSGRARIGRGEDSDIVGRITTILAVLALLSLALLLLVFAPGFLGGGSGSGSPTPFVGPSPTAGATQPPATATPLPAATPQTYTIKAGDSLFGIASRFGLTVEQLQAANPQITNPNLIQVGDVIVIPPPGSGVPGASPGS